MNNRAENSLREQLLFANGKLLSGFSHELKNHVAVINESLGLLQDFVQLRKIEDNQLCAKIEDITSRLEQRTETVAEMARQLNNYSHRFDTPVASFDLNQLMEEQLFFLKRYARLKRVSLHVKNTDTPLQIVNNPSLLQFLLQKLFEQVLAISHENDRVQIFSHDLSGTVSLGIQLESDHSLVHPAVKEILSPELHLCLGKTGAEITFDSSSANELEMVISIPAKLTE